MAELEPFIIRTSNEINLGNRVSKKLRQAPSLPSEIKRLNSNIDMGKIKIIKGHAPLGYREDLDVGEINTSELRHTVGYFNNLEDAKKALVTVCEMDLYNGRRVEFLQCFKRPEVKFDLKPFWDVIHIHKVEVKSGGKKDYEFVVCKSPSCHEQFQTLWELIFDKRTIRRAKYWFWIFIVFLVLYIFRNGLPPI